MASTVRTKRSRASLPTDLQAFCKRLGITRYVPVALRLLKECFPKVRDLQMYPECDPESGEEWLVLQIRVPGSVDEVRRQYDDYTRKKIVAIPPRHIASIRLHHYLA